jgi:hypothetical protein
MPHYLITVEQEGIGYPFLVLEARDRDRAAKEVTHEWEAQGWGHYDALRIELVKKDRHGLFRPTRLRVETYSRVQALVHTCLLDMQAGQVDRDHVLCQLCFVLTEVVPASIAQEVFEIIAAHERAGHTVEVAESPVRPIPLPSARLLAQEALADGMHGERGEKAMPQEEQQMQEQAAQDMLVDVLITPAADMTITPETVQALANDQDVGPPLRVTHIEWDMRTPTEGKRRQAVRPSD